MAFFWCRLQFAALVITVQLQPAASSVRRASLECLNWRQVKFCVVSRRLGQVKHLDAAKPPPLRLYDKHPFVSSRMLFTLASFGLAWSNFQSECDSSWPVWTQKKTMLFRQLMETTDENMIRHKGKYCSPVSADWIVDVAPNGLIPYWDLMHPYWLHTDDKVPAITFLLLLFVSKRCCSLEVLIVGYHLSHVQLFPNLGSAHKMGCWPVIDDWLKCIIMLVWNFIFLIKDEKLCFL